MMIALYVVIGVLLACTVMFVALALKKKAAPTVAPQLTQDPPSLPAEVPLSRIVIGEDLSRPLLSISPFEPNSARLVGKQLDIASGPVSRISSMLQAVPSVLVASEASTKSLYEVVINGEMVRAADGSGLRAIAVDGAGKISEHAKVFEVKDLQKMINAAAIWQIASVVVAQKHLADISKSLDEIKKGVEGISRFLDSQRKSRVQAAYDYLGQAHHALQHGELPASVRNQLEDCERDLIEIQHHLDDEFNEKLHKTVEHKEMFGSEDLANDIGVKIDELNSLSVDLAFCLKTRLLAWHVLSLYPGEPHLKIARREKIQESIAAYDALGMRLATNIDNEISNVKAKLTLESTLVKRREALTQKRERVSSELYLKSENNKSLLQRSQDAFLTHDKPTRLILEFENGKVLSAMECV